MASRAEKAPLMINAPVTVTLSTMSRFILGKQGLWAGRRWQGKAGVAEAIHQIGAVQIDPLVVVARSHDLELHSRVAGYQPDQLNELLYQERRFFDYGGALHVFPMEELPYWKIHMQRRAFDARWEEFASSSPALLDRVRAELRARGPLGHRDLKGTTLVGNYRARKDTGLALYYLWLIGEFMTAGRRGFDRLYDFTENVAPPHYVTPASVADAEDYFLHKVIKMEGIARLIEWKNTYSYFIGRSVSPEEMKGRIGALVEAGVVTPLKIEGKKDLHYILTADLPLLEQIDAGKLPESWAPLDTTTDTEVNFLSPLDPVSARGRAAKLFNFEYKWEIYTPVEKRKWGYYVLPILYGHALVARIDVKLDRPTKTMLVKGFWLEDPALGKDTTFAAALARGLIRFTRFHGVSRLDAQAIKPASLRAAKFFKGSGVTLL